MTSQIVELDLLVLKQVESALNFVESLSNEFLLLTAAIDELEDFYSDVCPEFLPLSVRRSLSILKHVASSQENSIEELSYLCDRIQTSLESSFS